MEDHHVRGGVPGGPGFLRHRPRGHEPVPPEGGHVSVTWLQGVPHAVGHRPLQTPPRERVVGDEVVLVIRVLREGLVVREELFRSTPVSIGRSPGCHLVLTEPSVSREHARIDRDPGGGYVIIDGAGTNGLYSGP
ncbi:MAG: FHA domain-containing protein, partial [Vicinamibacteria bacterium]|nr:FHA domain-containing protein [Vicinamibacteria bacterium]